MFHAVTDECSSAEYCVRAGGRVGKGIYLASEHGAISSTQMICCTCECQPHTDNETVWTAHAIISLRPGLTIAVHISSL